MARVRIAQSVDYNLSGERYKEVASRANGGWEMVELGNQELFQIESGGTPDSSNPEFWNGNIKWITLVDLPQYNLITEIHDTVRKISKLGLDKSSAKVIPNNSILVSSRATIGRIAK